MNPKDFIKEYMDDALREEKESRVPYLVTLGQAALESAWGSKAPEFNFFGIKSGPTWKGRTQKFQTHEFIKGHSVTIIGEFRAYDSAFECFKDHSEVLKLRFPFAFKYKDPVEFVRSMQTEHKYQYATDPNYVQIFASVVKSITNRIPELNAT